MSLVSLKKCALCVAFVATSIAFVGCAEEPKKPGTKPSSSSSSSASKPDTTAAKPDTTATKPETTSGDKH